MIYSLIRKKINTRGVYTAQMQVGCGEAMATAESKWCVLIDLSLRNATTYIYFN